MNSLSQIITRAKSLKRHIVLPEGADPRVIEAAAKITAAGIAEVTLLGESDNINAFAENAGIDLDRVHIADPNAPGARQTYGQILHSARQHKGLSQQEACNLITNPLLMAASMVRAGDADGAVAGAAHPTADVVRSGLQVVGMRPDSKIVSSFFLMEHDLPHQTFQGAAIYADCGLVIDPSAEELACIAIDSANSAKQLLGLDAKIALLSFSTAGSAEHPFVDKVRRAGNLIAEARPDLALMPEVQFDAAVVPDILAKKAAAITVAAPANIFIFPDLQSGNIGYKIAQRIGGVQAIGPILQGLKRPINDLSRGCSVDDIVNLVAVTAVQASQI